MLVLLEDSCTRGSATPFSTTVPQLLMRDPTSVNRVELARLVGLSKASKAHPLVAFFVTAFVLSWIYWGLVLGFLGLRSLWWFLPGAFAPPVAALIVTGLIEGRPGVRTFLRRCLQWRVGIRCYLLALVVLPLLVALAGYPLRDGSEGSAGPIAAVAGTYLGYVGFLALLGGGQEEPGWRGFALPRLQDRFGPLIGSVMLGLLWGLWHLPLFVLVPHYNNAGGDFAGIAVTFLVFATAGTVGQSLLLTWLFNHSRGSVLLPGLAHASLNAGWLFVASTQQASVVVFLVLAAAGTAVTLGTRGRLGRKPPPQLPSAEVSPAAPRGAANA